MKTNLKLILIITMVIIGNYYCYGQITYNYYEDPAKIGSKNPKATQYFIKSFNFIMQWGKEDTDSAIFYMQKAIEEDSLYSIAYASLGHLIKYGGYNGRSIDRDSIAKLAEKALSINPECGDALTLMSWIYEMKNEFYKAIESCKKAVEAEPDHRETWLWLGVRYSNIPEKIDSAIYAFNKSLEVDSLFGQPHQKLGWIYIYYKPDFEQAAFHFRKMIHFYEDILPRDQRMLFGYYGLGESFIMSSKWDKAIETLYLLLNKSENSELLWMDELKSMAYSGLVRAHMGKAKSELENFISLNLAKQDKYPDDISITLNLIENFDALSFQIREYDVKDTLKQIRMPLFLQVFDHSQNDYQIIKAIEYKIYMLWDEKKFDDANKELIALLKRYSESKEIRSNIYYTIARNYAALNETKNALKFLKLAIKEGFNDYIRIQSELNNLSDLPEFRKIMKS